VLAEHTQGLKQLTAAPAAVGGVQSFGGSVSVSASPEPSTILLLGTGAVAVARGLRRRMKQQR
jgi:hypothetical protein